MDSRNDVKTFMLAADQQVFDKPSPELLESKQALLYFNLINEEFKELIEALAKGDLVEAADACADLKWVIEGFEHSVGIPQQAVWDEVNRSNSSKTVEGKLIKNPLTGKVMKPDTYSPPDIAKILAEYTSK